MNLTKVIIAAFFAVGLLSNAANATYYTITPVSSVNFVPQLVWEGGPAFTIQNPTTKVQYAIFNWVQNGGVAIGNAHVQALLATILWCIQNSKQINVYCVGKEGTSASATPYYFTFNQISIVN